MNLARKPDAEVALDRFEAWWLCENRAPVFTLGTPLPRPDLLPTKTHPTQREAWLDFEFRIEHNAAAVAQGTFLAETFPTFEPNLGPDILSTLFGLEMEFAADTTWVMPIGETCEDILARSADFGAELWQAVERLQRMALEAGKGHWITLYTDLHPNADIPSAMIGPENLCMEFADDLNLVRKTIEHVTPASVEAYRRQIAPLMAEGLPTGSWMRAFSRHRSYLPQSDFSAMISAAMFEEAILPSIRAELADTDRAIYHLDGPDALRHLDVLLEVPEIHAIQWVYGAGNGPARKWEGVYKRILASGKGVKVECEDVQDVLTLHPVLGGKGVWYGVGVASVEDGQRLLESVGRSREETIPIP